MTGLVRTQYWNVGGPNPTPRTGTTSRAESRTDLEGYLLVADAARNAALHGWGVVAGLPVSGVAGQAGVTVAPGLALDIAGRMVVLAEGGVAIVDPQVGPGGVQNIPTVPVTAAGVVLDSTGLSGDLLVTITWREVEDVIDGLLVLRQAPWLRLAGATGFVEDGVQQVLAAVTVDAAGLVRDLTAGARRLVAVAGSRVVLRRPLVAGPEDRAEIGLTAGGGLSIALLPDTPIVQTDDAGDSLTLLPSAGTTGKLTIGAATVATRRADGTETITLDSVNARIGTGTTTPTHALHVTANPGLRQNRLYLTGNTKWSSLAYNAHHDDTNQNWVFPDPSRPAVTIEMDDSGDVGRLQVWTTTTEQTEGWELRLAIDGDTGRVTVPGDLSVGATGTFGGGLTVKSLAALDEGATTWGAWTNLGSNAYFDGAWRQRNPAWAGVSLHMNADGGGQEFRFLRMEPNGASVRNIAVLGTAASYILESRFGIGTASPDLPLTVEAGARFSGVVAGAAAPAVGYAFPYESVGVANPAFNLRLQSPNGIVFHTGGNQPPQRAILDRDGNLTLNGTIGTLGKSATALHAGWGGGIHTFDVEAEGTIWCLNDTISNGVMYSGRGFRTGTADVAELFEATEDVEPGDVVCAGSGGEGVVASSAAADSAVLGVVSTAPGLVLNAANTVEGDLDGEHAIAVALCGRVPCKVTAENGPIRPGDLLVSAPTRGHAMRLGPGAPVPGTILGKALGRLDQGTGAIDVLVMMA